MHWQMLLWPRSDPSLNSLSSWFLNGVVLAPSHYIVCQLVYPSAPIWSLPSIHLFLWILRSCCVSKEMITSVSRLIGVHTSTSISVVWLRLLLFCFQCFLRPVYIVGVVFVAPSQDTHPTELSIAPGLFPAWPTDTPQTVTCSWSVPTEHPSHPGLRRITRRSRLIQVSPWWTPCRRENHCDLLPCNHLTLDLAHAVVYTRQGPGSVRNLLQWHALCGVYQTLICII